MTTQTEVKTEMDTVDQLKVEAEAHLGSIKASWRDNDRRLIWCGSNGDGTFTFRNTTSATMHGPKISEAEAARLLAEEGPWTRPDRSGMPVAGG